MSPAAAELREELAARANEPYRGRRASSRVPAAWSDRAATPRRSGLFPPAKSTFLRHPRALPHLLPRPQRNGIGSLGPELWERVPGPPSAPAMVRVGPRLRLCLRRSTGRGCTRSVSGPAITGWDARDHRDHRRRRRAHRAYEDITAEDAGPALNSDPWHESDEEPATARPPPPPTTTVPVKARAEAAPGNYRVSLGRPPQHRPETDDCSSIKGWARLLRGHLRQQPRRPTNLTPV